jgi:hypothetical protein
MTNQSKIYSSYIFLCLVCIFISTPVAAETVFVKYRGSVDLAPFECEWVSRSSVVKRLCYDPKESYVIVNLTGTYYHYCEVSAAIVTAWRQADSMGRYYNALIKGNFDCRVNRVPTYE